MSARDPDAVYAELIETMSPEECEARELRLAVFAAGVRVSLGWIDYEVTP